MALIDPEKLIKSLADYCILEKWGGRFVNLQVNIFTFGGSRPWLSILAMLQHGGTIPVLSQFHVLNHIQIILEAPEVSFNMRPSRPLAMISITADSTFDRWFGWIRKLETPHHLLLQLRLPQPQLHNLSILKKHNIDQQWWCNNEPST